MANNNISPKKLARINAKNKKMIEKIYSNAEQDKNGTVDDSIKSIMAYLSSPYSDTRGYACDALKRLKNDKMIEPLLTALNYSRNNTEYCNVIVDVLCSIGGGRIIMQMLENMATGDAQLMTYAADVLSSMDELTIKNGETPLSLLMDLAELDDNRKEVRLKAIQSLSNIRSDDSIACLNRLMNSDDPQIYKAAVSGALKIGKKEVMKNVIAQMESSDEGKKVVAIELIGNWKIADGVDGIINAIKTGSITVKKAAITASSNLKDSKLIEPIQACYEAASKESSDEYKPLADEAKKTLSILYKQQDPKIKMLVSQFCDNIATQRIMLAVPQRTEAKEAAKYGEYAIKHIKTALGVSTDAHYALGLIGGDEAFDVLVNELKSYNSKRRNAAATALANMGDMRAIEYIRRSSIDSRMAGDLISFIKKNNNISLNVAIDTANPLGQLKEKWTEFNGLKVNLSLGNAIEYVGQQKEALEFLNKYKDQMESLNFSSTADKLHAWRMLGILLYYLNNPDDRGFYNTCKEAEYCFRHYLDIKPDEADIKEMLDAVKDR